MTRGARDLRDRLTRRSLLRGTLIGSMVCQWLGDGARLRAGQIRPSKK